MNKREMIRTITGLFLIDGLANYAVVMWAKFDPRMNDPVVYFLILPLINLFAIFLAFLQIYYYRHPDRIHIYYREHPEQDETE